MKDTWNIEMLDQEAMDKAQNRMDNLIKPVGSFATLEAMVNQAAGVQSKEKPEFPKKGLVVIGSDASKTLKSLARFTKSKVVSVIPEDLVCNQARKMGAFLKTEEIGLIGIALPHWQEEEAYETWKNYRKTGKLEGSEASKLMEIKLAAMIYLSAAENKILIMLDGPASILAAMIASDEVPAVRAYFISSRDGETKEYKEMQQSLNLAKGMRVGIMNDGGLSAGFALTLFDAALRTTREIATFVEAQVEYAYNAPKDKRM